MCIFSIEWKALSRPLSLFLFLGFALFSFVVAVAYFGEICLLMLLFDYICFLYIGTVFIRIFVAIS